MKILVLGDIVGKIGRRAVKELLPGLKDTHKPDLTIANGENMAHGKGITAKTLNEMSQAGIDFFTTGNHIWDKKDAYDCFADPELSKKLIRPANWAEGVPGDGWKLLTVGTKNVLVINLLGRIFGKQLVNDPFRTFDEIIRENANPAPAIVLVDFHAEATSEKQAFGLYAGQRATAVWGTHTHVATNDARILPDGPAYITDLGMCGLRDGIIGFDPKLALPHYLSGLPMKSEVPDSGLAAVNGIVIETNGQGQPLGIEVINQEISIN